MSEDRDLRAALQHAVAQICMQEETQNPDDDCKMTTGAVAALSELTFQFATKCLSQDLSSFSRHGNRRTITLEDVLLMARKDPQGLQAKLTSFAAENSSNKKETSATKPRAKKKSASPTMTQRMKTLEARLKRGVDTIRYKC